jgi:hypothetical protein
MFSFLRKRTPQATTGGNVRIAGGEFGDGRPTAYAFMDVNPFNVAHIYRYHEGDLFTPGAQNFVFEPNFELPLQTVWGFGFIRNPNTFKPLQPPQVWAHPTVTTDGLGGLQAGQFDMQPLLENGDF